MNSFILHEQSSAIGQAVRWEHVIRIQEAIEGSADPGKGHVPCMTDTSYGLMEQLDARVIETPCDRSCIVVTAIVHHEKFPILPCLM